MRIGRKRISQQDLQCAGPVNDRCQIGYPEGFHTELELVLLFDVQPMNDRAPLFRGQLALCELAQGVVQLSLVRVRRSLDKMPVFQFHTSTIHAKKALMLWMGIGPKLHVRVLRFDWIVMAIPSAGKEGVIHPTEILEPGEVLRHGAVRLALHRRRSRRGTVLGHTTLLRRDRGSAILSTILGSRGRAVSVAGGFIAGLAIFLVATAVAELDVIQNNDGEVLLLTGLIIRDGFLIVAAGKVDEGSFLQLHLPNPLAQITGRLDAQIDVAAVVFAAAVIDTLADTEAYLCYAIRFIEAQGRTVIVPLTDADIGCKEFEHIA